MSTTGSLTSAGSTIVSLASAATVTKGQFISGTGIPSPNFIATTTAAATTLNVISNSTTSAVETITIQNWPVLIGGEFSSTLAYGAALTSSYWNGTGVVRPQDTNQALFADIYFMAGGSVTPSLGQVISGWFLRSPDGATYETAIATPGSITAAISRAPDFVIPLDVAATVAGNMRVAPQVALPSTSFKTIIQNNGSTTLPAKCAIFAVPITPAY